MPTAASRRFRPRALGDWTLRARIVAGILSLLVVLCLAIGLFTEVALKHFLMSRLDDQLSAQRGRQQNAVGLGGPGGGFTQLSCAQRLGQLAAGTARYDFLLPSGSEVNTIGVQICATGQSAGVILQQNGLGTRFALLDSSVTSTLAAVRPDAQPHTTSVPGLGQYRVSSRLTPDGDVIVTALPLSSVRATLVNLTAVITLVTIVGLVIAAFLGAFIVRLALRPLRRVTATASKVAEMQLDEGEVALAVRVPDPNPNTEVGQVGVALNRMLENVSDALNVRHQSETRVRQFVADASHELRTPLASIRGYAELTRRSREVAPPDIAHAMTRVESEANRMTALVEDLLLLARLDAGRPLVMEEVDLTRLTLDVLSDAHAAGPDHRWHLEVGEEPVSVQGDPARLQQVLVNLMANARTHTPAGTNVWVSLSQHPDHALVEIVDDGPGIAPALVSNIFERFSRGEESRSRAAGSTGLGLAIVAAVVAAHSGQITVRSKPGQTIFSVRLPLQGIHPVGPQTSASLSGQIHQA